MTSGLDGVVMLNDILPGNTLALIEGHQDVVLAAEFSQCGRFIVTGSRDNIARMYVFEYHEQTNQIKIIP